MRPSVVPYSLYCAPIGGTVQPKCAPISGTVQPIMCAKRWYRIACIVRPGGVDSAPIELQQLQQLWEQNLRKSLAEVRAERQWAAARNRRAQDPSAGRTVSRDAGRIHSASKRTARRKSCGAGKPCILSQVLWLTNCCFVSTCWSIQV